MRTANRKPRINKKPSNKGMNKFLSQGLKAINKAIAMATKLSGKKQFWYSKGDMRSFWLASFNTSNYKSHQGGQEKARRVHQMATHKCINPEAWTYPEALADIEAMCADTLK